MDEPAQQVSLLGDQVMGLMLLVLVASLTALLSHRFPRLPYTIALVLVGIGLREISQYSGYLTMMTDFQLTPELVLFVFVPTLIFESAYHLDARELQSNLLPVLALAVPGLIISTGLIGGIIFAVSDFELIICLLLGAILSATDPVAVIAMFKQLGVPERLTVLVEGESLFNDATSLVLAGLLVGIALSGDVTVNTLVDGVLEFALVFVGGTILGVVFAIVCAQLLGRIETMPVVEISLTTVLAYLAFLVADHSLHVSGIMAVVAAGLIMGSAYGRTKVSTDTVSYLENFWDFAGNLANGLIFLMVGMQMDLVHLWDNITLILWVAVAMLISRAAVIFGLVPQLPRFGSCEPVSRSYQLVMYWGGLRGAIALAIVLALPEFEHKQTLIALVMGAVLFTLLFQGLSIEWLVNWLGLNKPDFYDSLAQKEGALHAKEDSLASLDRLQTGGFFSERVAARLRSESSESIAALREELNIMTRDLTNDEAVRILSMRAITREKSRYQELFRRGLVGEAAYLELNYNVSRQYEGCKHYGHLPCGDYGVSSYDRLVQSCIHLLAVVPGMRQWAEHEQRMHMMRDYQISWARLRASNSVLKNLDEMTEDLAEEKEVLERVCSCYTNVSSKIEQELSDIGALYPEFVEAAQEKLGERLMIISEQGALARVSDLGILPEGITEPLLREHEHRLRLLLHEDLSRFLEVRPEELLSKVPMFAGLEPSAFAYLASSLRQRSFPKEDIIIEEGAHGGSLFMVARGVAKVERKAEEGIIGHLYAGDVLGEAALLHNTSRNATVTAQTPCTLYELHRDDWEKICRDKPDILLSVEAVDSTRSH